MKQLIITLTIVCLFSSMSFAIIGPPIAELEEGKIGFGLDYSNLDIDKTEGDQILTVTLLNKWTDYYGPRSFEQTIITVSDFDAKMEVTSIFAKLGYGIFDKWEVLALIGMSQLDPDEDESNSSMAYGVGTKMTFYEQGKWKVGAVALWRKYSWDGDVPTTTETINWDYYNAPSDTSEMTISGDWEADVSEIKIAVGPTYIINNWATVYGGPFWHSISGDLESNASGSTGAPKTDATMDMKANMEVEFKSSTFGAFVGLNVKIADNTSLNVEYEKGADSNMFGINMLYQF